LPRCAPLLNQNFAVKNTKRDVFWRKKRCVAIGVANVECAPPPSLSTPPNDGERETFDAKLQKVNKFSNNDRRKGTVTLRICFALGKVGWYKQASEKRFNENLFLISKCNH